MNNKHKANQGLIVSEKDYKENDKLVLCFSRDKGKVNLLIERPKSNRYINYSITEPMNLIDFSCNKIPNTECFYYLSQAVHLNSYKGIRDSQLRLANAIYFTNYITSLVDYCEVNEELFDYLIKFLELIVILPEDRVGFYTTIMSLKALELVGLGAFPVWCSKCNEELDKVVFLTKRGLPLCKNCILKDEVYSLISADKWRELVKVSMLDLEMYNLSCEERRALEYYIIAQVGKEIKGYNYLKLTRD